uniref:phospholipase A2 inhibitor and Ly6/PLAUR domain-containing protein-like isoform X4 n=1 Tax=Pristiophorus japonicus TaxID=55135 RepID=UPI00398E7720
MSWGKEETFFAIFTIFTFRMVFAEAMGPLTCFICESTTGDCSPAEDTCRSDTCLILTARETYDNTTRLLVSKSCGSCSEPLSFSSGVVSISQTSRCCTSDLCNRYMTAEPPNTTQNGMECRGCFNSSSASCSDNEQTVKCVGSETRCINFTGYQHLVPIGPTFFARGCASEDACRHTFAFQHFSIMVIELPECCAGYLCNTRIADTQIVTSKIVCKGAISTSPEMLATSSGRLAISDGATSKDPVTPSTSSRWLHESDGASRYPVTAETGDRWLIDSEGIISMSRETPATKTGRLADSKDVVTDGNHDNRLITVSSS